MNDNLQEIESLQKRLALLCTTVQLTGLCTVSLGDSRPEQQLAESRNRHISMATNCIIMARMALEASRA